ANASPVSRHISRKNRLSAFRMANGTPAMPTALSVRAMVMPTSEPFAAPSVHMCVSRGHTLAAALGAAQAAKTAAQQIHLIAARMRHPLRLSRHRTRMRHLWWACGEVRWRRPLVEEEF